MWPDVEQNGPIGADMQPGIVASVKTNGNLEAVRRQIRI